MALRQRIAELVQLHLAGEPLELEDGQFKNLELRLDHIENDSVFFRVYDLEEGQNLPGHVIVPVILVGL